MKLKLLNRYVKIIKHNDKKFRFFDVQRADRISSAKAKLDVPTRKFEKPFEVREHFCRIDLIINELIFQNYQGSNGMNNSDNNNTNNYEPQSIKVENSRSYI